MVAAVLSTDLVVGLVLGVFVGLLIGPLVRSWLSWREWTSASREADLIADVLDRMDGDRWPEAEDPAGEDLAHPAGHRDAS